MNLIVITGLLLAGGIQESMSAEETKTQHHTSNKKLIYQPRTSGNRSDSSSWLFNGKRPSNQCEKDILYTWHNRFEPWARQMIDSYAKPESAVIYTNEFWFGDYDECLAVKAPKSSISPKGFIGQYCWLVWSYSGDFVPTGQLFSTGGCIPSSCSNIQFYESFKGILKLIGADVKGFEEMFASVQLLNVKLVPKTEPFSGWAIVCFRIIGMFVMLVILGTALEVISGYREKKALEEARNLPGGYNKSEQARITSLANRRPWFILRVLLCFSVLTNLNSVLNTAEFPGQMPCLHGIRFLSMVWVIVEHVFINMITATADLKRLINSMDTRLRQVVIEGEYSVDTFFLLSGFLLTTLFLKSQVKMGCFKWMYFYCHRYLRIGPPFFMVLFFCATVLNNISDGPIWHYMDNVVSKCSSHWWTHALFIANVFPEADECLPWAWYLPNDMQFFVFSPILLIILKRSPKYGTPLVWIIFFIFMGITFWITFENNIEIMMVYLRLMTVDLKAGQNLIKTMSTKLYIKPWSRVGPYLVGMLLGSYVVNNANHKVILSKVRLTFYWILATSSSLLVLIGIYNFDLGHIGYSLFHAAGRCLWAAGVSWVIYACVTGNAGALNSFLSWKAFYPLSRLSYCTYLVHPIFIYILYYSLRQPIKSNMFLFCIIDLGITVMSFATALCLSLLIEMPFAKLEKLLFFSGDKGSSKETKASSLQVAQKASP